MKKILSLLIILSFTTALNAQWLFESFDNAVGTTWPAADSINFYTNGPAAYQKLANDPDFIEGTGSIRMDYRVEANDGWGGYVVRTNYEGSATDLPYMDLSTGTELSLWYKVITPADTTLGGQVFTEFKLAEFDSEGNRDLFQYQPDINYFDVSGEWINIKMPLKETGDKTTGFALQFGDGDQELQFDKVKAFEISVVYITSGNNSNPPTATGTILFDRWELLGNRYGPIETFDNSASTWGLDWMDWAGADKGALAISDESVDFVEGVGALKMDYTLSAPFGWGGFVAVDKEVAVHDSMNERTGITLFMKNVTPVVADSGRAFVRVYLFEKSNGTDTEEWLADASIDLSVESDWNRYYIPLAAKPYGGNDRFLPKDGFAQRNGGGDGTLNPEAIFKIRIEPFGRGTEDGFTGVLKSDGTLLVDVMQTSGFRFADFEAPAAPVLAVVQGQYSNLVTWTDVPGETGERYTVYASPNPISDLTADGVEVLANGLLENIQVVEHPIVSANIDREKTYYYAVTCKDFAGNVSLPGGSGAVVNTAKGIPTVSITPPVFVADGDLSEWAGIKPFSIKPSDGTAKILGTVTDDSDISGDCYVAIDKDYLYVAFDAVDDVVNHDPVLNSWENDAPDIFIGLYDFKKSHVGYQHGARPDYHVRFGKFLARNDQNESSYDSLLVAGTANYYWGERLFPAGYVVEARIPLVDLATKRNTASGIIDTINWKMGDKVPFDFVFYDNDGATREGMIYYSHKGNDNAWQNVTVWAHTWIGDEVTSVDENPILASKYSLEQNYPNPFNPSTQIKYSIAESGLVKLRVFDILGRQVAELVNQNQGAGTHVVDFNASNFASGLYFYSVESSSFKATKKMMLIK